MNLNQADYSEAASYKPKISVIVPVYNGEADLVELIGCLQGQSYPAQQVEYILVDNGSDDRTAALFEQLVSEEKSLGITLQFLEEKEIQSSYAARNTGIRAAKGEFLVFTDVDCRPHPDWLESLIFLFAEHEVGIVVGEIVGKAGKTLLEKYAERHRVLSQQHTLKHNFCPYGQTANLALRRQAVEQVGLFRPHLTTGGDADLCWRILLQSHWQLRIAPEAVVEHRHRATLREYQNQWQRYGCSNRYLHELHGVDLMPEKKAQEYLYWLGRWLVKELPVNSVKAIAGKAPAIDILSTPLSILSARARSQGQKSAQLPEKAKEIEWLPNPSSISEQKHSGQGKPTISAKLKLNQN